MKKTFIAMISGILLLAAIGSLWGCSSPTTAENKTEAENKSGVKYSNLFVDDDEMDMILYDDGTYKAWITNGTYEYKSDNAILFTDKDGSERLYDIWNNYLVATIFSYDGEVPDGKTFDFTCKSTYDIVYTFKADGTYTFVDGEVEQNGTYERNGEIITVVSGKITHKLLIYKNKLNDSAYCKK